ncbi:MAG: hypothetical protein UHO61_07515 [Acutalibacteraceae bacterium]|nr:hypothetical protein [Acutalibacteraceae bacterium]
MRFYSPYLNCTHNSNKNPFTKEGGFLFVKSVVDDGKVINEVSAHLFGEAIIKLTEGWAKFNPARANYKAITVYCDDGTKYVVNLHFSET